MALSLLALLAGCSGAQWNNPYPAAERGRTSSIPRSPSGPSTSTRCSPTAANEYRLHRADLRAAAAVPLSQAALRADPARRGEDVREPQYLDARRPARCPSRAGRRDVAYSVYEIRIRPRHPLPAASGIRRGRDGQAALSRSQARAISTRHVRARAISARPARASSIARRLRTTRSSGSRIRGCIRRSSA